MLVFWSFSILDAFSWNQKPSNPTNVIEDGVSNKNVRLTWTFQLDANEDIVAIYIRRAELSGRNRVLIASRLKTTGFVYPDNTDFHTHYKAELPLQLVILNVDNTKEYQYIIQVTYSGPKTVESTVVVKVYGKWRLFRIQKTLSCFTLVFTISFSLYVNSPFDYLRPQFYL